MDHDTITVALWPSIEAHNYWRFIREYQRRGEVIPQVFLDQVKEPHRFEIAIYPNVVAGNSMKYDKDAWEAICKRYIVPRRHRALRCPLCWRHNAMLVIARTGAKIPSSGILAPCVHTMPYSEVEHWKVKL